MDAVNDPPGARQIDPRAHAVGAPCPACVHKPGTGTVAAEFLGKQPGVDSRVPHQEGGAEAGGEGHLRLHDPHLRACYPRSVAREEVVHRLLLREPAHRRKHPRGVTRQEDHVPRMRSHAGHLRIGNVFDRVGGPRVFRDRATLKVDHPGGRVVDDIFEHRAEPNRLPDLGLLFLGQMDALGVAASLNIEDAVVAPAMLIVANQAAGGISREGRLTGPGEAKEERHRSRLAADGHSLVRRTVH